MTRITDGIRTIEIIMFRDYRDITLDWLDPHFYAGATPLDDGTLIVDDVDWCIDLAENWRNEHENDGSGLYWHDVALVKLPEGEWS